MRWLPVMKPSTEMRAICGLRRAKRRPARRSQTDGDHGRDETEHAEHAPEGELAAQTAPVGDGFGIDGHR